MPLKSCRCQLTPPALEDVHETMPSRPATLNDPGTFEQILLESAQLDTFPESALAQSVRRNSRGRDSPHREQSKIDGVVP